MRAATFAALLKSSRLWVSNATHSKKERERGGHIRFTGKGHAVFHLQSEISSESPLRASLLLRVDKRCTCVCKHTECGGDSQWEAGDPFDWAALNHNTAKQGGRKGSRIIGNSLRRCFPTTECLSGVSANSPGMRNVHALLVSNSSSVSLYALPGGSVFQRRHRPLTPTLQPTATTHRPTSVWSLAAITYIISAAYMQIYAHGAVVCLIIMWPLLSRCCYTFTKVSTAPAGRRVGVGTSHAYV